MTQLGQSSSSARFALPGAPAIVLSWCALTDLGKKRAVNEDSVLANPPLFAVADGMGGHAAGDVASAAVVKHLANVVGSPFVDPEVIDAALLSARDEIDRAGEDVSIGTGTTVTGVVLSVYEERIAWAVFNIGDSRVYQFLEGSVQRLTVDHSVVQQLVDAGLITPEQAETHPDSNLITRAVGFHETPIPDYRMVEVFSGQRIIICSDGLTKELTDTGIEHYLRETKTAEEACSALLQAALTNGGRDNVSVVVIDVLLEEELSPR